MRAHNLVLVLDNVRSRLNVGSIFRTADAFGVRRLYLCGITPVPPHREIEKTALGATRSVAWEYVKNTREILNELQAQSVRIIAIEQDEKSKPLDTYTFHPTHHYAFLFGNELHGLGTELLAEAAEILEVRQYGGKKSLNIAVCVGVGLWAFQVQRLR